MQHVGARGGDLGVADPAAGGHQVDLAGTHHRVVAGAVAVLDLAGEQPAHRLQPGVRVRRDAHATGVGRPRRGRSGPRSTRRRSGSGAAAGGYGARSSPAARPAGPREASSPPRPRPSPPGRSLRRGDARDWSSAQLPRLRTGLLRRGVPRCGWGCDPRVAVHQPDHDRLRRGCVAALARCARAARARSPQGRGGRASSRWRLGHDPELRAPPARASVAGRSTRSRRSTWLPVGRPRAARSSGCTNTTRRPLRIPR